MNDFLAMGGYAAYVWPAYAIGLILLVGLFVQSSRAAKRSEAELERLRTAVRPSRARAPRPLRPRREAEPTEPPAGELG